MARYDLLVNRFITSKLSARGAKVVQYIAREAGVQRARRAEAALAQLRESSDKRPSPRRRVGVKAARAVKADKPTARVEVAEASEAVAVAVEAEEEAVTVAEASEMEEEVAAEPTVAAEQPPLSAAVLDDLQRLGLVRRTSGMDARSGGGISAGIELRSSEEMDAALEARWRRLLDDSDGSRSSE